MNFIASFFRPFWTALKEWLYVWAKPYKVLTFSLTSHPCSDDWAAITANVITNELDDTFEFQYEGAGITDEGVYGIYSPQGRFTPGKAFLIPLSPIFYDASTGAGGARIFEIPETATANLLKFMVTMSQAPVGGDRLGEELHFDNTLFEIRVYP